MKAPFTDQEQSFQRCIHHSSFDIDGVNFFAPVLQEYNGQVVTVTLPANGEWAVVRVSDKPAGLLVLPVSSASEYQPMSPWNAELVRVITALGLLGYKVVGLEEKNAVWLDQPQWLALQIIRVSSGEQP